MTTPRPISPTCLPVLAALEEDPLTLSAPVEAHLRGCPSCSEARIFWLALEEAPEVEVAPGYFEGLPFRILRKLPARRSGLPRAAAFWLAAASLLAALGLGTTGFYLGRAVRTPMVEAALPRVPAETLEGSETPFFETEDALTQFSRLTPRAAEEALQRLQQAKPAPSRK